MIRAPAAKSLKGMWIKNHLSTPHSLRFQQALIVIFGVKRYNYGGYAHFHILYYVLLRSNTFLYRSLRHLITLFIIYYNLYIVRKQTDL